MSESASIHPRCQSYGDEPNRRAERSQQALEVGWIGGDQGRRPATRRSGSDQRHKRIHHVGGAGTLTQQACCAGQCSPERNLIALGERSCQKCLTASMAPGLCDHTGVSWRLSCAPGPVELGGTFSGSPSGQARSGVTSTCSSPQGRTASALRAPFPASGCFPGQAQSRDDGYEEAGAVVEAPGGRT